MYVRWFNALGAAAATVAHIAHATQYMTVEQAQRAAFPQANQFHAAAPLDAKLVASIGAVAGWSPHIFEASDADKRLGWLIVDQVLGKGELIMYALALDSAGAVISVEVLDYRESHGGEIRLPAWRRQFVGKTAQDAGGLNREIKNISGATLSCRHLIEGVQRLLQVYNVALKQAA